MRLSTSPDVKRSLSSGIEVLIGSGAKFLACSDGKLAAGLCGMSPVEISAAESKIETLIGSWPRVLAGCATSSSSDP
jgi:hypothetical protein